MMKLSPHDTNQRLIFNNFIHFFSEVCGKHQHKGCTYALPECEFALFNSILSTNALADEIESLITEIANIYQHKKQFCWWVTDFVQPQNLAEFLEQQGFQKGSAFKGMIYDLTLKILTPHHVDDIIIQSLSHPDQLDEWYKIIQVSFGIDDLSTKFCVKLFKNLFSDSRFKHYYVEDNGKMVATASLFIENGVSGFYNLAVLPEYRHNKIATALKYHRLKISQQMGSKAAVIQSSEQGRALDENIGFKPLLDFIPYFSKEKTF